MRPDVLGLGQCAYDHLLVVPRFPGPHGKVEGRGLATQCGGPVATALWTLSRWGRSCALAGVVGDDDAGRRIRADLDATDMDTTRLLVRGGEHSQEAFITVNGATGERRIAWQRPTGAPPTAAEVAPVPCRVFLTDGLYTDAAMTCAQVAETVVVDAGTLREGTEAMIEHADVFVASEAFARALVGRDDPRAACEELRRRGAGIGAVTLGDRGWIAAFGDRVREGRAWPVEAVDTTGCGDVFHAGVVEGLLAGWPHERTFDFAAWAAAQCATQVGGRKGVPAKEDYPGPG